MPHLLQPLTQQQALRSYQQDLRSAHDALAVRVHAAAQAVPQPVVGASYWAVQLKLTPVQVAGAHPMVLVPGQPFAELVNQLATIERLLDAIDWAERQGMTHVDECHPTTSRGPAGRCSHDLVVTAQGSKMVFEVSDVAGNNGNGNSKITNDLATLLGGWTSRGKTKAPCTCTDTNGNPATKLLAVSPVSGAWLQKNRPNSQAHVSGPRPTTWIVQP
jgi:hypothetical protein